MTAIPHATSQPLGELMRSFKMSLEVAAIRTAAQLGGISEKERVTAVFEKDGVLHGFMTVWGGNISTGYLLSEPIAMPTPEPIEPKLPKPAKRKELPSHCMKVTYVSAEIAKQRLREISAIGLRRKKSPINYYKCPKCGGYHLTSKA